jgi:hypothetical protein
VHRRLAAFLIAPLVVALAAAAGASVEPQDERSTDEPKRPPGPAFVMPDRTPPSAIRQQADLASLRRLVSRFDFEDSERFPTEMPRDWYRLLSQVSRRPGYPDFGTVALTDAVARDGRWSLEFVVDGGSMAVALPPGIVRIFQGSRYRISAWIRTEGVQRAAARVVARLYDKNGQPTGDEWASEPIRSDLEWTQVRIELAEIPPDAFDIGLELEVVQPSLLGLEGPGGRPIGDDVRGRIWFDDLEIWQVPSIRFSSGRDAQIFETDETPELEIELRDLVSDELAAEIVVTDIDDRVVFQARKPLPGAGALVKVPVPLREPGAYRALLTVTGEGMIVARRAIDLAVVDAAHAERTHGLTPTFGLVLPSVENDALPLVKTLALRMDPDFAMLPAWRPGYEAAGSTARIGAIADVVDALLDRRIEPMLMIDALPPSLASTRHLDGWQIQQFLGTGDAQARALVEPWLLAFGSHIEHWQIGGLSGRAPLTPLDPGAARRMHEMLEERVAGPVLLLPAQVDREDIAPPKGIGRTVRVPWTVRATTANEYLEPWGEGASIVVLERAPEELLTERDRIEDLALRTLDAWRAGAPALAIELPWRFEGDAEGESPSLDAEVLAWRELGRVLGGRTFIADFPTPDGVRAWIADGASGPLLIVWRESGQATTFDALLGNAAVRVGDVFGRAMRLELDGGLHRVPISTSPVFIEGIDLPFAKLLASIAFDPPTLDSRRGEQDLVVRLRNPFPVAITGTLALPDQRSWDISPREQSFSIPANTEGRIQLRVALPRTATAGPVEIVGTLDMNAGEPYVAPVRLRTTIDWPAVHIERSWRYTRSVETGHVDVAVTVRVTNLGDKPLDLDAFAMAKGFTQTRKPILKLGAGETAVRVFQFPEGARRLGGEQIFAGVSELDGDRRLADYVRIPPLLGAAARAE